MGNRKWTKTDEKMGFFLSLSRIQKTWNLRFKRANCHLIKMHVINNGGYFVFCCCSLRFLCLLPHAAVWLLHIQHCYCFSIAMRCIDISVCIYFHTTQYDFSFFCFSQMKFIYVLIFSCFCIPFACNVNSLINYYITLKRNGENLDVAVFVVLDFFSLLNLDKTHFVWMRHFTLRLLHIKSIKWIGLVRGWRFIWPPNVSARIVATYAWHCSSDGCVCTKCLLKPM